MARIRTIKPDFWEDEKIAALPYGCRLLYIGTWNIADDLGVFRANVALLKSKLFPYDEGLRASDVKKWMDALVKARMLIPFTHNNESYYKIRTFQNHQKIDKRYGKPLIDEQTLNTILSPLMGSPSGTHSDTAVPPPQEKEQEYNNKEQETEQGTVTVNNQPVTFEMFWEMYDKKIGEKNKLRKRWDKLTDTEKLAVIRYIPGYVQSQPDKKYRKNPETFLNNRAWEDEIIYPAAEKEKSCAKKEKGTPSKVSSNIQAIEQARKLREEWANANQ